MDTLLSSEMDNNSAFNLRETPAPESASRAGKAIKLFLALLLVAAIVVAAEFFNVRELLNQAIEWIDGLGFWGPLIFIALYVLATVFFLPGSVLTLGAGTIFGVAWGSIYVSIASTLGATAAFIVGRYFARDWVAKRIEGNKTFAAIDDAVAREGWKIVGLTRLSPVFPFNLLNYALGLTKVRLPHYILASWIGMMPGTVMYVYLGSIARAGAEAEGKTTGEWILYGAGLLATVVVTAFVTRIAYKALSRKAHLEER